MPTERAMVVKDCMVRVLARGIWPRLSVDIRILRNGRVQLD